MNFYALIIGTEILNGRRVDKHFEFVKNELAKYSHELFASFIVKDDTELITQAYELIKADTDSIMFSFGGIGSTPDDLTREISSKVFTSHPLETHEKFRQDIINRFGDEAYPHRVHMADLPPNAKLLQNPVNNMSGYSLQERFFFVPGFPQMAHPMISNVIQSYFSDKKERYRETLIAQTSENTLIDIMNLVPSHVELSSLPMLKNDTPSVELSLIGSNKEEVHIYFQRFCDTLNSKKITYQEL